MPASRELVHCHAVVIPADFFRRPMAGQDQIEFTASCREDQCRRFLGIRLTLRIVEQPLDQHTGFEDDFQKNIGGQVLDSSMPTKIPCPLEEVG